MLRIPSETKLAGSFQVVGLVEAAVKRHVPEVAGLPVIGMSALTGAGAEALMPAVLAAHQLWTQRVPTARLNGWLAKVRLRLELLSCGDLPSPHPAVTIDEDLYRLGVRHNGTAATMVNVTVQVRFGTRGWPVSERAMSCSTSRSAYRRYCITHEAQW